MLTMTADGRVRTHEQQPTMDELMQEQRDAWTRLARARRAFYSASRGYAHTNELAKFARKRAHVRFQEVDAELEAAEQAYKEVYNKLYAWEVPPKH